MDKDTALQKLTEITSFLQTLVECPVCMESVTPPARQCSNGHVTCSSCAARFPRCSLCDKPFLKRNPTLVNNLLDALPRLCRYSVNGCKDLCVPPVGEHEKFCGFRNIFCREAGCSATVNIGQMYDHCYAKHYSKLIAIGMFLTYGKVGWTSFKMNYSQIINTAIYYDSHMFYYKRVYDADKKQVTNVFEAFFIGKPKYEYFLCIKFESGSFEFSKTIKAISMEGDRDSGGLETVSAMTEDTDEFIMDVSQGPMQRLAKNGPIYISLRPFRI